MYQGGCSIYLTKTSREYGKGQAFGAVKLPAKDIDGSLLINKE